MSNKYYLVASQKLVESQRDSTESLEIAYCICNDKFEQVSLTEIVYTQPSLWTLGQIKDPTTSLKNLIVNKEELEQVKESGLFDDWTSSVDRLVNRGSLDKIISSELAKFTHDGDEIIYVERDGQKKERDYFLKEYFLTSRKLALASIHIDRRYMVHSINHEESGAGKPPQFSRAAEELDWILGIGKKVMET